MSIPAIIILTLYAAHLLISAHMHGQVIVGKVNFWGALFGVLAGGALLYWGGFFA